METGGIKMYNSLVFILGILVKYKIWLVDKKIDFLQGFYSLDLMCYCTVVNFESSRRKRLHSH